MLIDAVGKIRQRLVLTKAQTQTVVALQPLLQATGLILVCPKCQAGEGSHIEGDVDVSRPQWRLTCDCTERVMDRSDVRGLPDADGELVQQAEDTLRPVRLSVRCGERSCVGVPVDVTRGLNSAEIRCQCSKTTLRPRTPTLH